MPIVASRAALKIKMQFCFIRPFQSAPFESVKERVGGRPSGDEKQIPHFVWDDGTEVRDDKPLSNTTKFAVPSMIGSFVE
jgi:hypothetical protein